ncbi:hypothetical protein [Nostoc sp. TCL240-02]|uniref:hypothetical protein n=1 Tax=Nostoc sp. TCL240-02 TaxID=2572090 RepID=UPI00157F83BD|nr:hypothetical protein [Nostoc sp. TCL240-02]QKQ73161.1 hypothetical protein FBB35_07035 [Nostoc sp. TCL240-02]
MDAELQQVVQLSDPIQATVEPGTASTFGQEFRVLSLTNFRTQATIVAGLPDSAPPLETEQSFTVQGSVERYLVGHKGELKGLLLSDRSQLQIPRGFQASATQIQPGDQVIAEGMGVCRESRTSLRVTTLQVNGESLSEQAEPARKHLSKAIEHHEQAAHHHLEAAKHLRTGDLKQAEHQAQCADEQHRRALKHTLEPKQPHSHPVSQEANIA